MLKAVIFGGFLFLSFSAFFMEDQKMKGGFIVGVFFGVALVLLWPW